MATNSNVKHTHPLQYLMWVALASIAMMFAGLSSAVIVKRSQANWVSYNIPIEFFYSTATILFSSLCIHMAKRAFAERQLGRYTSWLGATIITGFAFILLQYLGFYDMWKQGVTVNRNVSFSFLYVIVGLHAVHILGGLIALIILFFQSLNRNKRVYSSVYVTLMATYWHFVDILWIYLLLFLILER